MIDENQLIERFLSLGAYRAGALDVEQIPLDPMLRSYCEANICGSYGRNYACPPSVGEAETLIARVREYDRILLFQTVSTLEDSFDWEGMQAAAERHAAVCESIRSQAESVLGEALYLTAGGCTLCPECAKVREEPCRFPDRAVSSLEAYCINVSSLAPRCGMKYINGADTVTYFGAFLYHTTV